MTSLSKPIQTISDIDKLLQKLEGLRRDKTINILIIESNFIVKKILKNLLEQMGFVNVDINLNGYQCINHLKIAKSPNLVLYSLSNQDLGGEQFLKAIQPFKEETKTSVIVVSAPASMAQIEKIGDMGADGFVFKPIEIQSMVSALKLAGVW